MRAGLLAAMAAVMVVSACATVRESRLNPLNWFGRSEAARIEAAPAAVNYGGRIPVADVTELHIEPANGGAIIRAKGVPQTQGWYQGDLVLEPSEREGELSYRFVVQQPEGLQRIGTAVSREVTVATFVSDFRLEGIRQITVAGAQNARTTRRR